MRSTMAIPKEFIFKLCVYSFPQTAGHSMAEPGLQKKAAKMLYFVLLDL
jgi:hypothetical protein